MTNDARGQTLPGLIHKQTMSISVEAPGKADNDNISSQDTAQAAPNFLDDLKPLEDIKPQKVLRPRMNQTRYHIGSST